MYLLYQSPNGTFETVKKWDDVPRLPGSLVTQVDDSWFPSRLPDNAPNKTWNPFFFILTDGYNIQEEIQEGSTFPPPVRFTLIRKSIPFIICQWWMLCGCGGTAGRKRSKGNEEHVLDKIVYWLRGSMLCIVRGCMGPRQGESNYNYNNSLIVSSTTSLFC